MEIDLEQAAEIVKNGGVGAFPTETVYGLGAHPFHEASLERIFAIKGREKGSPLSLHISSLGDLFKFAQDIPKEANKLIQKFWPGPLAIIVPASSLVPPQALSQEQTVSFRYPDCGLFLEFARLVGTPIAGTSANKSGSLSPICAQDVEAEVGGKLDFLIDGGTTKYRLESTIVDLTTRPFSILREGVISKEELEERTGFSFQLSGVCSKSLSLILIEGSEEFFQSTLEGLSLGKGEIALSSCPLKVPYLHLKEDVDEDELFRVLSSLKKEGFSRIYLRNIWLETSRIYFRLKIRAEKIIKTEEGRWSDENTNR
ncbi:MAG: L-threonylcarbamoyladenylate synthase [bacterium]